MHVSLDKIMYQLQEKTEFSGGKNLKHILVYSCAGGWISYTAGSMLFFLSKATKQKSATMVQTILYVWLVLSFCVMERQFTEFRFLSGQYQKKRGTTETNTNIKHRRISLRKLVKAAFFLKSQGMAKPDTFFCFFVFLPWQHCRADYCG